MKNKIYKYLSSRRSRHVSTRRIVAGAHNRPWARSWTLFASCSARVSSSSSSCRKKRRARSPCLLCLCRKEKMKEFNKIKMKQPKGDHLCEYRCLSLPSSKNNLPQNKSFKKTTRGKKTFFLPSISSYWSTWCLVSVLVCALTYWVTFLLCTW